MKNGFAAIYLVIGLFILAILGFGYSNFKNTTVMQETPTAAPTSTPSLPPTATPTLKPIVTKKPSPQSPSPTSVVQNPCAQFKPENGLTSITITLKEKDGKPLAGDWTVKIKPASECPGQLPPMWGGQINEVIRQPNYTYTSPGMGPGKFRVDVNYHAGGEGFDWDGTSGNHSREITVTN